MRIIMLALPIGLALAGCEKIADPRGVDRDEVLLQVVATGRTDTRPDEARFTAGVQTLAATAAAASAGNNRVMERVAAALERLGVKEDDLQTRQITLARIDYGPERGRFQANNMIEVRVRGLQLRSGPGAAAAPRGGGARTRCQRLVRQRRADRCREDRPGDGHLREQHLQVLRVVLAGAR